MTLKRYAEILRAAAAAHAPLSDEARASVLETIEVPEGGWADLSDPRAIVQHRWHFYVVEGLGAHAQDIVTGKAHQLRDFREDSKYSTVYLGGARHEALATGKALPNRKERRSAAAAARARRTR